MPSFLPCRRGRVRAVALLASVVVLLAGAASSAQAAFSVITDVHIPNGELVLDQPTLITVHGTLDPRDSELGGDVRVEINEGAMPCGATPGENLASSALGAYVEPGSTAVRPVGVTAGRLGPALLCVYLWDNRITYAHRAVPVTVRQPRATLELRLAKPRFEIGERMVVEIHATAEVRRYVYIKRNPLGMPCGPTLETTMGDTVVFGHPVHGAPLPKAEEFSGSYNAGRYHLCGWVAHNSDDTNPAASFDGAVYAVGHTPWCRLSSAHRALRVRCTGVSGLVQVEAWAGKRMPRVRSVRLRAGTADVRFARLGLRKGQRARVTVRQRGLVIGRRTVQRR